MVLTGRRESKQYFDYWDHCTSVIFKRSDIDDFFLQLYKDRPLKKVPEVDSIILLLPRTHIIKVLKDALAYRGFKRKGARVLGHNIIVVANLH